MDFINWLITSSADPKKTSLMVKGIVMTAGAFIVQAVSTACTFGVACLGIDADWINQLAQITETLVFAIMLLIGSVAAIAGLLRKIKLGRFSAHR